MDPIVETVLAFATHPVVASALLGILRSSTGWIQKKYKEKTGQPYDPKVLGATILKYEIASNALIALIPPEHAAKAYPVVLLADIIFSAAKKLRKGK